MKPQYNKQQGMLIEGNFWLVHPTTGEAWTEPSVAEFIEQYQAPQDNPDLEAVKQMAVGRIKQQAGERIGALDWQLQRAEERLSQAEIVGDTELHSAENQLLKVLDEREAIREQSNEAERLLLALETLEAIESFTW